MENILLSVVIPARNEESIINILLDEIIQTLNTSNIDFEIIVVDDGSEDGTFHAVANRAHSHNTIKGIQLSRHFGKEAALLAGLQVASGNAVVTMDADLQHPPAVILEMLDKWRCGAHVVHAVRSGFAPKLFSSDIRSRTFSRLFSLFSGLNTKKSTDFKLLDRSIIDILVKLPEVHRLFRGLAHWIGFEQEYVSFAPEPRRNGQGKWSVFSLFSLAATAITSFSIVPLRFISILGFLTLIFSLAVGSEALWSWIVGESVSGFATLILTILILGSFIMISLGIIGEYIGKIYEETKHRPLFLISANVGFDRDKTKEKTGMS
ncbi:MAG: glycosyltransferase family 2 protein [Chromatiales bacterium]|nr:glycosyltransferase family 2 protein [Gammaproteobacteria bacterium]